MKTNYILDEIRRTRDKMAAEAGYDPKRLFAMIRERQAAAAARGVVFIPEPKRRAAVRDDAAPYGDQPGKEAAP
jgi:hypothetical protein